MALAEGNKIGFYTSSNLKTWTYISGFFPQVDLGVLECPDLYQLDVDGDATKRTWVSIFVRDVDGVATESMATAPKQAYDAVRTAPVPLAPSTITLSVYVDWNSVEIFVNNGVAILSGPIYPDSGAETIEMVSGTGQLTLDSFTYAGVSV
ncbi:hypothetical protein V1505DRAFT_381301 [Lipomyces doorenjongii]